MPGKLTAFAWAIISLLIMQVHAYAQGSGAQRISGHITSKQNGAPLEGATVTVKGTRNSVKTDETGAFTILASPNERLVVSYIGYTIQEIKVGSTPVINVSLAQDFGHLDDVVVVGYGKMKKSDMSAAVESISAEDLNKTVNTTLDEALLGKAANVYVSQTSGQPGAGATVIIRGISTVTGNSQPLYVIDGVQIRPSMPRGGAYNQPSGYANELSGINPDDIENISVLEGPAATSIYGAAGANGVLMITTKRGKAGIPRVNVNSTLSWQNPPKHLPTMNLQQYARYIDKLQPYGVVGGEPAELGDPSILGGGTDWQSALFRTTLLQKEALSVSGGTDKSSYYFSGDYLSQQGIAVGSGFNRGSVRVNLDNQATNWLKFGMNLSVYVTHEKVNTTNGNVINIAISQNPTIPVKNPDGSFGGPSAQQAQYSQTNPIGLASIDNNYNKSFGALGGIYVDITPVKNLTWHTEANGNVNFTNNYTFYPAYNFGALANPTTNGSRGSNNNTWQSLNTRVQYDWKHGKHSVMGMVGHEASYYTYESLSASGRNYSTPSIQELSVSDPQSPPGTSGRGDGSQESYFARLNYVFNDKYILQGVVRRDGSSNFGPSNRFGTFPAVSAAWKISDEPFMKDLTAITDLKFRGEWGISGNTGNSGGAIYSGLYAAATVWGGGFSPSNFPNPNLKWEQDQSTNVGFDLHMFNNRLEVIADAYVKNVTNLILVASAQEFLGGNLSGGYGGYISWPTKNYGSMQNKGFGVTVNGAVLSTRDLLWKVGGNFSMDRNKVTKLYSLINTVYTSETNETASEFLTEVGQPLAMITGYIADGLFQNYKDINGHAVQTKGASGTNPPHVIDPAQGSWVGDIKFRDISGPNGKPDGLIDANDRTIIGNPWPKFNFSFNTSVSYKGFELYLLFTGVNGNSLLNLVKYENELIPTGKGIYSNVFVGASDFAAPSSLNVNDALTATLTNPGHIIPRPIYGDPNGNSRLSQWAIEDGSYLKLKSARLSYRFPTKYLSYTKVFRGAAIVLQGQNLLTFTKYTGYDPEVGMYSYKGVTNIVGLDDGRYPSTRSYSVTLNLDF
jgi:TonB-linked SusC/RagA family outer membrane protein